MLRVGHAIGAASIARLWSTDPDIDDAVFELEILPQRGAERIARALSPVCDVQAGSLAAIADAVGLVDLLGARALSAPSTARRWSTRTHELRVTLGRGAAGPVEVDLVDDGPHALIAGTSGPGKSELLQSMVASLASRYSPQHVNFLFVDYKGGASSDLFARLPHTVGQVTNLDGPLAQRALVSLRAEIDRRMALLQGRAKDLAGLVAELTGGGPAVARDRDRRVRHPGQGGPRVHGRHRRHRPARPQPRHPSRAGHATPVGLGEREHSRQHQHPDRVEDARTQ